MNVFESARIGFRQLTGEDTELLARVAETTLSYLFDGSKPYTQADIDKIQAGIDKGNPGLPEDDPRVAIANSLFYAINQAPQASSVSLSVQGGPAGELVDYIGAVASTSDNTFANLAEWAERALSIQLGTRHNMPYTSYQLDVNLKAAMNLQRCRIDLTYRPVPKNIVHG